MGIYLPDWLKKLLGGALAVIAFILAVIIVLYILISIVNSNFKFNC